VDLLERVDDVEALGERRVVDAPEEDLDADVAARTTRKEANRNPARITRTPSGGSSLRTCRTSGPFRAAISGTARGTDRPIKMRIPPTIAVLAFGLAEQLATPG